MSRETLWRVVKLTYVVLVAAFLAWALYDMRASLLDWRKWLAMPGVYAFILAWAAMAAVLGYAWARVLQGYFGLRLAQREWLPIQAVAWAGRYLPGKIGLFAGKLPLLQRGGIGWHGLGFSVLFEQFAFLVTGMAVAMAAPIPVERFELVWLSSLYGASFWLRSCIAIGLLVIFVASATLLARKARIFQRPGWIAWLLILSTYLLAHCLVGIGFYLFLQPQIINAPPADLGYAIALLAFANVAGILAVFAPAGFGVREMVIAVGLTPYFTFEQALAIATVLRILTVLADLAFFTVAIGLARFWRRKVPG